MITDHFKNRMYATQKITARAEFYGKSYFWMEDIDGTIYLVREDENGIPDLS